MRRTKTYKDANLQVLRAHRLQMEAIWAQRRYDTRIRTFYLLHFFAFNRAYEHGLIFRVHCIIITEGVSPRVVT